MNKQPHVVVVGAGAFGGWTALQLLRRGARVTLLDAWGPGNSRSSSGGDTLAVAGARAAVGPQAVPRHRRALAGRRGRPVRASGPPASQGGRHPVRGALRAGHREALPADQLRSRALGHLRAPGRIPHRASRLRECARGIPRRGR
ncbi:MAG: hypothetical protein DMD67_05650 [Gemmatimonadetes bacterium]|nr:MAG: hypothetical protein DMD67_05650 [Gemmatimonadota bacterium]